MCVSLCVSVCVCVSCTMCSELAEADDGQETFSVDKHNLLMSSCNNNINKDYITLDR